MYKDVLNLFNILHELVFKNYEIEYFDINVNPSTERILIRSRIDGFFIRIDFDKDRTVKYRNTIQFSDSDYRRTDEVPLDDFNKTVYFEAVMLNTPLKYDDVMHIAGQTSMFAKANDRSVSVSIKREIQQIRR